VGGLRPGAIILRHVGSNPGDGSTLEADALATIIRRIESRGYTFATLPAVYAAAYPGLRVEGRPHGQSSSGARGDTPLLGNEAGSLLAKFLPLGLPLYCGSTPG